MTHAATFDAFQHDNIHNDTHNKKPKWRDGETKMSNSQIFDTLRYANKLKAVGVPEKQAEVQAEVMVELIEDKLATKKDLEIIRSELKLDIETSKNELKQNMKVLELRMTIKLGSIMVGGMGAMIFLMKFFKL